MGRQFIASAAVTVAAVGLAAAPALAKTTGPTRSLSNGKGTASAVAFHRDLKRIGHSSRVAAGPVQILRSGQNFECTVPQADGSFVNFFTRDTVTELFNGTTLVASCSADLNNEQTTATAGDKPGKQGMIPFSDTHVKGSKTLSASITVPCNILDGHGNSFTGTAESVTYTDGEFLETCIADTAA
jgi:hypothetical protein